MAREINIAAAKLDARLRRRRDRARRPSRASSPARSGRPTRPCRCRPTSTIPAIREVDFDEVKGIYREQIDALVDGGVDFILIETVFDTLNAKAGSWSRPTRPPRRAARSCR